MESLLRANGLFSINGGDDVRRPPLFILLFDRRAQRCHEFGHPFWAGNFMWVTLAAMAEVFVAQYNGSKQYGKLGEPVWQMIWLSGFSLIFLFL